MNWKNYLTVNTMEDAAEKDWCISIKMLKTIKQASVKLNNNKSYDYLCRFPIKEGDVVVIGKTFAEEYISPKPSATTGQMGETFNILPKRNLKKDHASELDFVFTNEIRRQTVMECVEHLNKNSIETVQYAICSPIYPITCLIRKLLAAASIISHPTFVDDDAVKKAKAYICSPQIIDEQMLDLILWVEFEKPDVDLTDIHVFMEKFEDENYHFEEDFYFYDDMADERYSENDLPLSDPSVNIHVNKFAYIGAISIMVRGGFVNLLNAFLSVDPPIKDFYDEMIEHLGNTGNPKALEIIRGYTPVK